MNKHYLVMVTHGIVTKCYGPKDFDECLKIGVKICIENPACCESEDNINWLLRDMFYYNIMGQTVQIVPADTPE